MKKLLLMVLWFIFVLTIAANAAEPKFQVHVIKNLSPGVNYSINTPVIIDYDNDGDQDIVMITKEETIYFLENLLIA